jgi:hypothetical protein
VKVEGTLVGQYLQEDTPNIVEEKDDHKHFKFVRLQFVSQLDAPSGMIIFFLKRRGGGGEGQAGRELVPIQMPCGDTISNETK